MVYNIELILYGYPPFAEAEAKSLKKIVHKSPIPLYAVAATWLLYALLFPLYRLPHYLLAAAAAAVVGIVARLFCPNTVEEVAEEPKSTGNEELDKMIANGRAAIGEMKRLDENIADPTISAQIVRLQELSGKIFAHVEQHPEKLPQIRKFMNYYLPTTLKILNAYDRMGEQGIEGANISSTMHRVEEMMATIVSAFEKLLDDLFGAEAMDITTDMVVLENMMAREGLSADPLHSAATAAQEDEDDTENGGITLQL